MDLKKFIVDTLKYLRSVTRGASPACTLTRLVNNCKLKPNCKTLPTHRTLVPFALILRYGNFPLPAFSPSIMAVEYTST